MATSNIQETGLENWIYFIPETEGYEEQYEDLKMNLDSEEREIDIEVYDRYEKEIVNVALRINIAPCYYEGANLIILANWNDSIDLELSNTNEIRIERAVRKLEKIMAQYSTQLRRVGSFSNGETIYEKA